MNRSVVNWVRERNVCTNKEKRIRNLLIVNSGLSERDDVATLDTEELLVRTLKKLNEERVMFKAGGKKTTSINVDYVNYMTDENASLFNAPPGEIKSELAKLLRLRPVLSVPESVSGYMLQTARALVQYDRRAEPVLSETTIIATAFVRASAPPVPPPTFQQELIESRADLERCRKELQQCNLDKRENYEKLQAALRETAQIAEFVRQSRQRAEEEERAQPSPPAQQAATSPITSEVTSLRVQIASLTSENESLATQNDEFVGRNDDLAARVAALEEENGSFTRRYQDLREQNHTLTEQNATLADLNSTLKDQMFDMNHENAALQNDVAALRQELESRAEETQYVGETLQKEIERCDRSVDTGLAEIRDELRQMRERYERCNEERLRLQADYDECLAVNDETRKQTREHLDTIETLNKHLEDTHTDYDTRLVETSAALEQCRTQNQAFALEIRNANREVVELRDTRVRLLNERETHLDQIHGLEMQMSERGVELEKLSEALSSDASVERRTQQFLAESRSTDNTIRTLKDDIQRLRIQLRDREEETDRIVQDVNETCRQKIEQRVREMTEEMETLAEESRVALANISRDTEQQCDALDASSELFVPLKQLLILCIDNVSSRPAVTLDISQRPIINADFVMYVLALVNESVDDLFDYFLKVNHALIEALQPLALPRTAATLRTLWIQDANLLRREVERDDHLDMVVGVIQSIGLRQEYGELDRLPVIRDELRDAPQRAADIVRRWERERAVPAYRLREIDEQRRFSPRVEALFEGGELNMRRETTPTPETGPELWAEEMHVAPVPPDAVTQPIPITQPSAPVKKRMPLLHTAPISTQRKAELQALAATAAPEPRTVRPNERRAMREAGYRFLNRADLEKALTLKSADVEKEFAKIESDPSFSARRQEIDAIKMRRRKKFWKTQMKLGTYTGPLKPEDLADVSSDDDEKPRQFADLHQFVTDEGVEREVIRRRYESLARARQAKRSAADSSAGDNKYAKSAEERTLTDERRRTDGGSDIQTQKDTDEESIIQV